MNEMSDKKLLERLVELKIVDTDWGRYFAGEWVAGEVSYLCDDNNLSAPKLITHDWRVAGAMIVALRKRGFSFLLHSYPDGKALMTIGASITTDAEYADPNKCASWEAQIVDDNDARAIIEAGAEALS